MNLLILIDSNCGVLVYLFSVLHHADAKVLNTSQVQGVMRRGMTVEGLQEFVLTQGMSKAREVNSKQQPLIESHIDMNFGNVGRYSALTTLSKAFQTHKGA